MSLFNPTKFRKARKELGYTQKQFAEVLRTSQRSLCFWETGRTIPSKNKTVDIAVYFALQFDVYRAHKISGLEIDAINSWMSNDSVVNQSPPPMAYKKILIITYESGVQRWFPVNAETLETVVSDLTTIDNLQIVEQGDKL
jgi:DNA-binding XRE family transcriptional regulator|tara:strand:+ start:446 stop:868 length:423 start_codon:yes stop_codon:yes gene_type:complete